MTTGNTTTSSLSSILMRGLNKYAYTPSSEVSSKVTRDSITSSSSKDVAIFNSTELSISNSVIYIPNLSHYFVPPTSNENIISTGHTDVSSTMNTTHLPLLLNGFNHIKIPNKTEVAIRRHVGIRNLKRINEDPEVALELCLVFLSNLTDTHFRIMGINHANNDYNAQGWKNLSSKILRSQFNGRMTYKKIVDVLLENSSKGAIIECDYIDRFGEKCYGYRLGDSYRSKGVTSYEIKTEYVRNMQYTKLNRGLKELSTNSICSGLLETYPLIDIPSHKEVYDYGVQLSKSGYMTKKGKKLTLMNKNGRNYWKNKHERSYIEDNMDIFSYLTDAGILIPSIGGDKSGGRVVDSFTLMPSWQRSMLKIEGEKTVNVDYSCLHPNLSISLYGGKKQFITHDYVSTFSGIDKSMVKIEHLSFFNKKYEEMVTSPLWNYYFQNEADMLASIVEEKAIGVYGHKETSRNLFSKEVEIMSDVFSVSKAKGIPLGYVYDAVFCKESDAQEVKKIMDIVAMENGVYTQSKIEWE